jgi:ElaA protein
MKDHSWHISSFEELDTHKLYALLRLRVQVFVLEQECLYQELDDLDQVAEHLMCWRGSILLAYLRILKPGSSYPESSLGRVVVAPQGRGLKLGRELVQRGIDYNSQRWPDHAIQIGAQTYLESFYRSLGFTTVGASYIEDGIPHIHMIRALEEK